MILILGGTTDTHKFIENANLKANFIITVTTDYGSALYKKKYGQKVIKINFNSTLLHSFIKEHKITKIIDTTHPYALEISQLAKTCADELHIDYIYAKRKLLETEFLDIINSYEKAFLFKNYREIANYLKTANYKCIFFTIGVKNLHVFKDFIYKSYVRILPDIESIKTCLGLGTEQKRIIAMQGPFTTLLNCALIDTFNIDCMITKCSGKAGGFYEKFEAARSKNIDILVVPMPETRLP